MTNEEDPDRALARCAERLASGVEAVLAGWVVRCVTDRMSQWTGEVPAEVHRAAVDAGDRAREEVAPKVAALLRLDIDEQPTGPLDVVRGATRYPTAVLADAGVPPVMRDEVDERLFPDDVYGLVPASFADVDPALHGPGLEWGAAKAFVHLARRRAEGRR